MNFVENSLKCSSEELILMVNQFGEDLDGMTGEAELMEGVTDDFIASVAGQTAAFSTLKHQFGEFVNKTGYIFNLAQAKQAELDHVKKAFREGERRLGHANSKVAHLEVR